MVITLVVGSGSWSLETAFQGVLEQFMVLERYGITGSLFAREAIGLWGVLNLIVCRVVIDIDSFSDITSLFK